MLATWLLATFSAFALITFIYVTAMAVVGHLFGVGVETVSLGFDVFNTNWKLRGKHWDWQIGWLPLGGYTKFRGHEQEGDEEKAWPKDRIAIRDASTFGRILILLAGPVSSLLIGLTLLSVAAELENPRMTLVSTAIETDDGPATIESNAQLSLNVFKTIVKKLMLFQELDGWGGWTAALYEVSSAALNDYRTWLCFVGVIAVVNGLANLLPLGVLIGGQVIWLTVCGVLRIHPKHSDPLEMRWMLISSLFLYVVLARIVYADVVYWLFS